MVNTNGLKVEKQEFYKNSVTSSGFNQTVYLKKKPKYVGVMLYLGKGKAERHQPIFITFEEYNGKVYSLALAQVGVVKYTYEQNGNVLNLQIRTSGYTLNDLYTDVYIFY